MVRVVRFAPAVAVMAAIWVLSSRPLPTVPISGADKIVHVVAYAVVGACIRWGVGVVERRSAAAFVCWLVASLYGAIDEVHQSFVPGRTASPGDWTADAVGAAIGVWLLDRCMRVDT